MECLNYNPGPQELQPLVATLNDLSPSGGGDEKEGQGSVCTGVERWRANSLGWSDQLCYGDHCSCGLETRLRDTKGMLAFLATT